VYVCVCERESKRECERKRELARKKVREIELDLLGLPGGALARRARQRRRERASEREREGKRGCERMRPHPPTPSFLFSSLPVQG